MAIIIPAVPPETSPNSERKVRSSLASVEKLVALHSVVWQARRNGRPADGEADFVLPVPGLGILILEVKGGGVELDGGRWTTTGADGITRTIKNPFEQAKDSKYALLSFFQVADPPSSHIPIVHAVCFPDLEVSGSLGMNAPRALIIDRTDLKHPEVAIERIFEHWEVAYPLSGIEIDKIVRLLAPTTKLRRMLKDDVEEACEALVELTNEQTAVLQSLRRVKRAAILGGAGTGKTIMAAEKARQLQKAGFRTLLLCYNAPLRAHLAVSLADSGVDVQTFHTLAIREARAAKRKIPREPNETWFEQEAAEELILSAKKNGTVYDAVLVDEAQDFSVAWLSGVERSLLAPDGQFYVFADSHQDLYQRGWKLPEGLFEYELTINCRNTRPIAEKVAHIFGDTVDTRLASGPSPRFIETEKPSHLVPYVSRLVESLISDEHISPEQLIVLADSPQVVNELRTMIVEGYLFTTLEGRGIPVETIRRFKGLERDVVIAAITDQASTPEFDALAYVGLSRAKAALYVIGSAAIRRRLRWDE